MSISYRPSPSFVATVTRKVATSAGSKCIFVNKFVRGSGFDMFVVVSCVSYALISVAILHGVVMYISCHCPYRDDHLEHKVVPLCAVEDSVRYRTKWPSTASSPSAPSSP